MLWGPCTAPCLESWSHHTLLLLLLVVIVVAGSLRATPAAPKRVRVLLLWFAQAHLHPAMIGFRATSP